MPSDPPAGQTAELDAFVSYARADSEFVLPLTENLQALGRSVWLDVDGIPPGAPWRHELGTAIEAAVAFVFVVSPRSVASDECLYELDRAAELGKRLIPVLLVPAPLPEALASIQWIDAEPGTEAATAAAIAAAIDADYEWAREHTRWLARALRWQDGGNASLLPRGIELKAAEAWLERQAEGHDPRPTELQTRFVAAARRRERSVLRRVAVTAVVGLVAVAALGVAALWQREVAVGERDGAQSRALAATAIAGLDENPLSSLALALRAHEVTNTPESVAAMRSALQGSTLRRVLRGNRKPVARAAITDDGTLIASANQDGRVWLWGAKSDRPRVELKGLTSRVEMLAFRARGTQVLGVDSDGTIRLWRTGDGVAIRTWSTGSKVTQAMTDAAVGRLITSTSEGAQVWQVPSGKLIHALEPDEQERALDREGLATAKWSDALPSPRRGALSPDGRRALTGGPGGVVRLWDLGARTSRVVGRYGPLTTHLGFSRDGKLAMAITTTAKVQVYDTASGRTLAHFPGDQAAFSPDSRWVVTTDTATTIGGGTGVVSVRGARSGRRLLRTPNGGSFVDGIAISPDGRLVATGSWDGPVRVWDRLSGATLTVLDARHLPGTDLDFAADSRRVVTVGRDGGTRVWDVTGTMLLPSPDTGVGSEHVGANFDAAGTRVLTLNHFGTAALVDSRTGTPLDAPDCSGLRCLTFGVRMLKGDWRPVYSRAGLADSFARSRAATAADPTRLLAWAPAAADLDPAADRIVVGTRGGIVAVVNARTGVLDVPLVTLDHGIERIGFSPDGRTLLAGGGKDARLLDADTGKLGPRLRHPKEIEGAVFAEGGAIVATADNDGTVRLWRARDGRLLRERRLHDDWLRDIAAGPRGVIAVADGDSVKVWNTRSDRVVTLPLSPGAASAVALSRDGAYVAGGGASSAIRVWESDTGRPVATLGRHDGAVTRIHFGPDSRRILTTADDGSASVIDCFACVAPTDLVRLAEARLRAQLTPREREGIVRAAQPTTS